MIEQYSKVLIFSVERSNLSTYDNFVRNVQMINLLYNCNISYKQLDGFWKGTKEASYLIEAVHRAMIVPILFKKFDQDCYLLLDIDREAFFVFPHETIKAGYFKETDKLIALTKDGYTFDPVTDRYYIVQ